MNENEQIDVVLNSPDIYLEEGEWTDIINRLKKCGLNASVDLMRDHPMRNASIDDFLILLLPAVKILLEVKDYKDSYDALIYTIKFIAKRIRTQNKECYMVLETDKGHFHAPISENIMRENPKKYLEIINSGMKIISPQQDGKHDDYIFNIDDGTENGKWETFEEYGNKQHRDTQDLDQN